MPSWLFAKLATEKPTATKLVGSAWSAMFHWIILGCLFWTGLKKKKKIFAWYLCRPFLAAVGGAVAGVHVRTDVLRMTPHWLQCEPWLSWEDNKSGEWPLAASLCLTPSLCNPSPILLPATPSSPHLCFSPFSFTLLFFYFFLQCSSYVWISPPWNKLFSLLFFM